MIKMNQVLCYYFWVFAVLISCVEYGTMGWNTTCTNSRGNFCVDIRDCPEIYTFAKLSPPPLQKAVVQILRKYQCGVKGKYPYVCCSYKPKHYQKVPDPQLAHPVVPNFSMNRNLYSPPAEDCGRIATIAYKITGGAQTTLNEYPWMALLYFKESDTLIDFKCSGTVINRFYVLTAAHCVYNQKLFGIRLGEHNVITNQDCNKMNGYCAPSVQDRFLDKIIVHPNYSYSEHSNDIALIRLERPANFDRENVQPICLPAGELADENLIGKYLTVSGWGTANHGFRSSTLLQTRVPVVPVENCRRIYGGFAKISYHQICAGGERGQDSCRGDSGGPLKHIVEYNDGISRYVQYGIVSYGPRKCGLEGYPAMYTNVAHYMDWISEIVKSHF